MGYYTRYSLTIEDTSGQPLDSLSVYNEINSKLTNVIGVPNALDDLMQEEAEWKWYDHENDMRKIAKEYPNLIFTLSGEGEEQGDIWVEQYCGDEFAESRAKFIMPDPNPLRKGN